MKYIQSEEQVIKTNTPIDIKIPDPIAHIDFDVYFAGSYEMIVREDGSYTVVGR